MAAGGKEQKNMEEVSAMGSRNGQSTLEYILMVAAIVVAVILGVNKILLPAVKDHAIQAAADTITSAADHLKNCTDGNDATKC